MLLRAGHDCFRYFAPVEYVSPFARYLFQGIRQVRLHEYLAGLRCPSPGQIGPAGSSVLFQLWLAVLPPISRYLGNRISLIGQSNSRSQHLVQLHRTARFQQSAPAVQCPRDGNGLDTSFRHLLQAHASHLFAAGGIRGTSAGIQRFQFPALMEIYQREEVAAQPGHHRLHHVQGSGGGDGSINGIAALLEHTHPGLGRQVLTRCHHAAGAGDSSTTRRK